MKKTLSIILALVMSLLMIPAGMISSAAVGEVDTGYTPAEGSIAISSVAEFERISSGTYHLTQDLDFSGKTYTDYVVLSLSGTLDGCGHTIKGITVTTAANATTNSQTRTGIFGEITGTLKNLIVGTEAAPAKINSKASNDNVGCLVGDQRTNIVVENVKIYTEVETNPNGSGGAGGMFGYLASASAIIKNCEVNGSVTVNKGWAAGGFVERVKNSGEIYVENCVNNADVTFTHYSQDPSKDKNRGTGGFFGCLEKSVTIVNCVNRGDITTDSNYAGGIVAYLNAAEHDGTLLIQGCENYGTISGMYTGKQSDGSYQLDPATRHAAIGGIFGGGGYFDEARENTITIEKCMNYGLIKTNGASAGAIMGKGAKCAEEEGSKTFKIFIKDTGNVGRVEYGKTDADVGTFIGIASTSTNGILSITNCFNIGTTNSTRAYACVYNMDGDSASDNAVVSDFYFLNTAYLQAANSANIAVSNAVSCTAEKFENGEVAFNLGFNFGQVIGEDDYPTPGANPVVATGSDSVPFANLHKLSTKTGGASALYAQTTENDTQGKQDVRFIIAVDSAALESAASAQIVISFKKTGAADLSYTLDNDKIKVYKSIRADGGLYIADDGCAILGVVVPDVGAEAWSSVEVTFTVKDAKGAEIALVSTSGTYSK